MKTTIKIIAIAACLTGAIAYAGCACGDKCTCPDKKCACTAEKCACPAKPASKADDCAGACAAVTPTPAKAAPAQPAEPPKVKPAEGYKHIDLEGVQAAVTEGKAVILDARAGKWDDGKRIPGAKQLAPAEAAAKAASLIPTKDSRVIVYCTSPHCPASKYLAAELIKLGYTHIEKYADGIEGWEKAGKPVEQAAK